jgi:hypothetical protein
MNKTASPRLAPPRLSMDAYVDFVDESFRDKAIKHIRRQKEIEERIKKRFSLADQAR